MLSITDTYDKETLCSQCNVRGVYCEATSYGRCDCCDCMPQLCVSSDHAKGVTPTQPTYKVLSLEIYAKWQTTYRRGCKCLEKNTQSEALASETISFFIWRV